MLIEREGEVGAVLLGQRGERQNHVGDVEALVVGDGAADLDLGLDPLGARLDDPEDELAVVDEQPGAGLDRVENLLMRKVGAGCVARRLVAVEDEGLAGLQFGLVALELADAQFRPLQVGEDRRRPVELGLERADRGDPLGVIGVGAVAHVDPEGVGARLGQAADHRRRVARRGRASPGSSPCACAGRTGWWNSPSTSQRQ